VSPKRPGSTLKEDGLVGLIGQRWDAPAVQELLQGLCAHALVETDSAMSKNRHLYLASGVVVDESARDRRVVAIHLYGPGARSEHGYRGALPRGLAFGMARAEAVGRMGPPDSSGLLEAQLFDAWELNECLLRVTYGDGKAASVALLRWYPLHKRAAYAAFGVRPGRQRPTRTAA
jgi:hypothetical protein